MWGNHSTAYLRRAFNVKSCSWSLGGAGGGIVETQYVFLLNLPFPHFIDLQIFVPRVNSQFLSWWHILCIDIYCGFGYIYVCPRASALIKREIQCLKAAGPVFSGSTHPCSRSFWVCLSPENLQTKTKFRSKEKCLYMWQQKKKEKSQLFWSNTLPAHLKTVLIQTEPA